MAWTDVLAPGVTGAGSALETARFGVTTARMVLGQGADQADFMDALSHRSEDVLIVRYEASHLEVASWLSQSGYDVLPAGALTYWDKDVDLERELPPTVRSADELPNTNVRAVVQRIVRSSFVDYGNHYLANPLFNAEAALAGYEEWALNTLAGNSGNVLVLLRGSDPIGIATLESGPDARHVEVLLAGLVPEAQGRGLYADLLAGCEAQAALQGIRKLVISTQVHNVRPQRAWARFGLRPFGAVETVHLIRRPALYDVTRPPCS